MSNRIIPFFTICFFTLLHSGQAQTANVGVIDLSQHDFNQTDAIKLSGDWEFYWNQLLTPDDFKTDNKVSYISVPGSWNRQGYPILGYATYRIKVILPGSQRSIALYFPIINSSAKIWANGAMVSEVGSVTNNPETSKPKLSSAIVSVPDNIHSLELVVQVSNFAYFTGGLPHTPKLQNTASLLTALNRANGVSNFFAGSLIAMFIYQVILFYLYQRGKSYLWLSLICLGVALRALIVHGGSFLLPELFPFIGWEFWKKIEFGSVYGIIALFPLYVYNLFIEQAPKKPLFFFIGISFILLFIVLVTPQYVYGQCLEVAHISLLFAFIYAVYAIHKAMRAGNQDAKIILLGVLASFPFILAEILKNSSLLSINIRLMFMVEMGVLIFLLFQVYLLANHFARSFYNLEKKVDERTQELVTANMVKDRLLSVISHDIRSPLNSLRGVLHLLNLRSIAQDEFNKLTHQLEGDLSKTSMLVENILYWTASQLKGIHVKLESFNLHSLVEENINLFGTIASAKKVLLSHRVPLNFSIVSDRNIMNLILRNLMANAIKFSLPDGEVCITVEQAAEHIKIFVKDSGVGMSPEILKKMFSNESLSTHGTSNEKGTGLGLNLCNEYLKKAGGQLFVKSQVGHGSTFIIQMPLPSITLA